MMSAVLQYEVDFDIGESYLYGTAKAVDNSETFAINLQGGGKGGMTTEVILPHTLMAIIPYANKAKLNIRTSKETITLDAKIGFEDDMIEIFDDKLLEKIAHEKSIVLEIIVA